MAYNFYPNPRDDPMNADIPNVNKPATIIGVTVTMLTLGIMAMTLRLWVRIRDRLWGCDDAFVLFAGLSSVVGDSMVCLMPKDGLGLHFWTLDYVHLNSYFKHIYSTNVVYCASSTFIKLAILFQYLRLFSESASSTTSTQYRIARRVCHCLIVASTMWGLTFFLLSIFSCAPIEKNWNIFVPGRCIGWGSKEPKDFFPMFAAHAATNMVLDFVILLTPLPFLGMMRLAGKSKVGLITLFTLGCMVCAVSIGRLVSLAVNKAGTVPIIDMSFFIPTVYLFSVLEVNLAIIAASIPIFWPVIVTLTTNKIWVVNEIEIRVESNSRNSLSSSGEIGLSEQGSWSGQSGKAGRLSVLAKAYTHQSKHSTTNARHDAGNRSSNESQRILVPSAGREVAMGISGRDEWLAEADRQNTLGTTTTKIETAEVPYEQIRKMER